MFRFCYPKITLLVRRFTMLIPGGKSFMLNLRFVQVPGSC
jgi:hypothetical protein